MTEIHIQIYQTAPHMAPQTYPEGDGGVLWQLGHVNGQLAEERQEGGRLHLASQSHQEVGHGLSLALRQDLEARDGKLVRIA